MKRALANAYQIDPLQAHPNFGSNGSIDTIMTAMKLREVNHGIDPTKQGGMLVATPTYFRNYNSCASKQVHMTKVPLRRDGWSFDLDAMLKAMAERHPTVVFMVTPNNPTGTAVPDDAMLRMIEAAPQDTLIVIDRTLVNIRPEIDTVEILRRSKEKQVAVLHSASKYAGLSHLRVGFALYSNAELAQEIRPHLPLGLGVEGAVKVTRLLVQHGPLRPTPGILQNVQETKVILDEYCRISPSLRCSDFSGNYCVLELPCDLTSEQIAPALAKQGIYVMGGHDFPEPDNRLLRLHTGGKPEFMQRTVEALRALIP
jgi:histidinol-phosphate/aromatic aminotransferase/cobyric acid decarboxylase-like protein